MGNPFTKRFILVEIKRNEIQPRIFRIWVRTSMIFSSCQTLKHPTNHKGLKLFIYLFVCLKDKAERGNTWGVEGVDAYYHLSLTL